MMFSEGSAEELIDLPKAARSKGFNRAILNLAVERNSVISNQYSVFSGRGPKLITASLITDRRPTTSTSEAHDGYWLFPLPYAIRA